LAAFIDRQLILLIKPDITQQISLLTVIRTLLYSSSVSFHTFGDNLKISDELLFDSNNLFKNSHLSHRLFALLDMTVIILLSKTLRFSRSIHL